MIETYLQERSNLRLVVLILDIRRDPSEEDRQLIRWLQFYRLRFLIVLTKTDKLSKNQLAVRRRRIAESIILASTAPLINFSAKTGEGKELIWKEIRKTLMMDPDDGENS
jgi:GTP-binding protein